MAYSAVHDDAYIVVLLGDLDVYRAGEVRRALRNGADKQRLIIDLSQAETISAAILTEFVRCHKHRHMRGLQPARIVLRSEHVRKVFEITKLAQLWLFFESVEAASVP